MSYKIVEQIGLAATLEQTAEEAAELAQAALKLARIIRKENPTPVTYEKAYASFVEEATDVRLCLNIIEIENGKFNDSDIVNAKLKRWQERMEKLHDKEGGGLA